MRAAAGVAVVMPIRSFSSAKTRLAGVLTADSREALARYCATVVLAAARPLPVFVVCNDADVADWAKRGGAEVVEPKRPGLNEAASAGREAARATGLDRVIVVHADLPLAESLTTLDGTDHDVLVVPDRHDDGTNAMLLPTAGRFDFRYGPGSRRSHVEEATRRGLTCAVAARGDLALDLDSLDDLHEAGIVVDSAGRLTLPPHGDRRHSPRK